MESYRKSLYGIDLFLQFERKTCGAISVTKVHKIHFKISSSFITNSPTFNPRQDVLLHTSGISFSRSIDCFFG